MMACALGLAACSSSSNPPATAQDGGLHDHFAAPGDTNGQIDVAVPDDSGHLPQQDAPLTGDGPVQTDGAPAGTTLTDINNGTVANGATVTVTGLVVTGLVMTSKTSSTTNPKCKYSAFLQDPNGTTLSGIKLFLSVANCGTTDGGTCYCPYTPNSGTEFDKIQNLGDIFTVVGTVSNYTPSSDGGTSPVQHEITPTTLTLTGTGGTITPYVATSPADFALSGTGYVTYESMVVTINAGSATTVGTVDQYGAFTFDGAHFVGDYRYVYDAMLDGGVYPASNATFTSITGVADPAYNGGIGPRLPSDFVP
jgi:hypothetical protein